MNVLVVDDGTSLRGYDCGDVMGIEEIPSPPETGDRAEFLVRLGRLGNPKGVRCREIVGFYSFAEPDVHPLPQVVKERMTGEVPWGVGITERGLCLLY